MRDFIPGNKAVSPVIGTILMVAITVIMAAIIGGFVYQTSRPKIAPNLAATLVDDERVILIDGTASQLGGGADQRAAKLTIEGGRNIAISELKALAIYTDGNTEYTVVLDGSSWADGIPSPMGADRIMLKWVDSDGSSDLTPGDRLDFIENYFAATAGQEISPNTDFTVKIVHKSTQATLVNQTVRVY